MSLGVQNLKRITQMMDSRSAADVFALIPDILSRRQAYMLRSAAIGRALGIPRLLMPNPSKG